MYSWYRLVQVRQKFKTSLDRCRWHVLNLKGYRQHKQICLLQQLHALSNHQKNQVSGFEHSCQSCIVNGRFRKRWRRLDLEVLLGLSTYKVNACPIIRLQLLPYKEICSISRRCRVLAHRPCPKLEMFCPSVLQLFYGCSKVLMTHRGGDSPR